MQINFTPFLDLFSILAIGLLVVMITTAGTDMAGGGRSESDSEAVPTAETDSARAAQEPARAAPVLVGLYPDDSEALAMMEIEPYFLEDGVEVDRPDNVLVARRSDGVEVVFRSGPGALSVGFAVAAVREVAAIGRDVRFTLTRVGGGTPETQRCVSTVGSWREPTVPVDGAGLRCGGVGAP